MSAVVVMAAGDVPMLLKGTELSSTFNLKNLSLPPEMATSYFSVHGQTVQYLLTYH